MLLTTIRPTVSQATITKVGRLFNGTLPDILNELFQNARRAGASVLRVNTHPTTAGATLTIADDGCGIADPASIVTLGHSGWTDDILTTEDPAGMGVFSLAGRAVSITSGTVNRSRGWTVAIAADQWDGSVDLPLSEVDHPVGTTIAVDLPADWLKQIDGAVAHAARYFPLPVIFDGAELARNDWLEGALAVSSWNGSRVGVFEGDDPYGARINFHGVTIKCALPSVAQRYDRSLHARIDIGSTPSLQLVLPARKEAVENAGLADLRVAVERAIYTVIAARPSHSLPFEAWQRAVELGLALPEADARLFTWCPQVADSNSSFGDATLIEADDAILVSGFDPHLANPLARALRGHPLRPRLVAPDRHFVGYDWYDALARIDDVVMRATTAVGTNYVIAQAGDDPELPGHVEATAVTAMFDVRRGETALPFTVPTDVAFGSDHDCWEGLDGARVVWTRDLTPEALEEQLEAVFFSSSDDHDADSWHTQQRDFQENARNLAVALLTGSDAALIDRLRRVVQDHCWFLPEKRSAAIAIVDRAVTVTLEPEPA